MEGFEVQCLVVRGESVGFGVDASGLLRITTFCSCNLAVGAAKNGCYALPLSQF